MSSFNDVTQTATAERLTGRVKWFNNKAGYGFVTVTDGSRSGTDIFVHHSAIGVENQQYKYLVQGEYVEFSLTTTQGGNHEFQAASVGGINGGKLMCETRREFKMARTSYKGNSSTSSSAVQEESSEPVKLPRQQRVPAQTVAPRVRGEGPRDSSKKEWTVVGKSSVTKDSSKPPPKPRGRPPRSNE